MTMDGPITKHNGRAIPEQLLPYVQVLGVDLAVDLFLKLGGSQINLPAKSGTETRAAKVIGAENVERLAEWFGTGYVKVPLGNKWVAEVLHGKGLNHQEIACTVRSDVATVRRWINMTPAEYRAWAGGRSKVAAG